MEKSAAEACFGGFVLLLWKKPYRRGGVRVNVAEEDKKEEGAKMQVMTGVVLLLWAWEDMQRQKLRPWRLGAGMAALLVSGGIGGMLSPEKAVFGLFPGIFLLVLSVLGEKESGVGEADGVAVLLLGLLYGIWASLTILLYGLCLCCLVVGVLWLVKKIGKKDRLPFLPFLLGGYLWYFLPEFLQMWAEVRG